MEGESATEEPEVAGEDKEDKEDEEIKTKNNSLMTMYSL